MLYTGVDWADQKHDALVVDETGKKLGAIRVPHTAEGLTKLDTWLVQILGESDKEQMACIVETNHGLLIAFLLEHGWPVYPVNPRTVDRRRSASGAKTDEIDAYWAGQNRASGLCGLAPAHSRQREGRRTQRADP